MGLIERLKITQSRDRQIAELEEACAERTLTLDKARKELAEARAMLNDAESRLTDMTKLVSLGELGAGIAHELNSPLAGVLSIAELLLAKTDKKDQNYYLFENIKDAALRCKYIVKDMLAYASPAQSGFERVLLNEALIAAQSLFISELKSAAIEVEKDLQIDLPPVYGHKGQIMEVLLNIIKNARDAMHGSGKISIATYQKEEEGARYAVAQICDTGPGIADGVIGNIFDPFFSTKLKDGGLNIGLGLFISMSIVKRHNGRIEAANLPSAGAVFRVWLPVYDDAKHKAATF